MQILYVSHKAVKPLWRRERSLKAQSAHFLGCCLGGDDHEKGRKYSASDPAVICLTAVSLVSLLGENWSAPLPAGIIVADYLLLPSKKAEGVGNAVWLYRWLIFHQTEASLWVTDLMFTFKTGFLATVRALCDAWQYWETSKNVSSCW